MLLLPELPGLDPTLAERVVTAHPRPVRQGPYVLYWMRTAQRGHENPALDLALEIGRALRRPVLVYQGLSEQHPFANDRHYTFQLEGARDVALELAARGVAYALHVERPGQRGPFLRQLAQGAAAVVTEEMPVEPLRSWTARLAAATQAPVFRVDTACVLPMSKVERAHDRAFAFRRATERARTERLSRPWVDVENAAPAPLEVLRAWLPFEPVDPATMDIAELVAASAIDHSVPPVAHTPGGSRAGYARWDAFRAEGLHHYARRRNDPLRRGVSRLSAYLHQGQVSPLRLARQAAARGGAGAEKFLDELLIWRELAHVFCFHTPDVDGLEALPDWARQTLAEHADDPRPELLDDDRLARGRTGDPLWDAAQRSLLLHGELHNNVRMTWGKALLNWSATPEQALRRLIDLNHRYALDGRDPSSYGGLLWCLGAFDRPFDPERPVQGRLRGRSTREHARRLDVARYEELVTTPAARRRRVAVVGAGLAGLLAARTLQDHGHEVLVFDKGRAPGGRCSTRRLGELQWDHGAQLFKDHADPRVARHLRAWEQQGVLAPWEARYVEIDAASGALREGADKRRLVGAPGMSAVPRALATELDVRSSTRVQSLAREGRRWRLVDDDGGEHGPFDACLLALPAPQAGELLRTSGVESGELLESCERVEMTRSLSVLLAGETRWELPFDAAYSDSPVLAWAARDSSKPGRPADVDTWVLQATPAWSAAHFDDEPAAIVDALTAELAHLGGAPAPSWIHADRMRWGFAVATEPRAEGALHDRELGLALCGDWLVGDRLGDALLSGEAAAGRLLGAFAAEERRAAQGSSRNARAS